MDKDSFQAGFLVGQRLKYNRGKRRYEKFIITAKNGSLYIHSVIGSDITIDWGDGTKKTGIKKLSKYTHTFPDNHEYTVVISGILTEISFLSSKNLAAVITPFPQSMSGTTSLYGCFGDCENLSEIPNGLFDNCTALNDVRDCFIRTKITTIPAGLFDSNKEITSFYRCFANCSNLTAIPAGLFDNNTKVTDFTACFGNCPNLTAIPAGLFDNNTEATSFFACFAQDESLTTIPEKLFDNNTKVTDFCACFAITSLTSIPAGLFDNNTKVTTFEGCFYGCKLLIGDAPALWERADVTGTQCYYDCTKLSNYSIIPSDWK